MHTHSPKVALLEPFFVSKPWRDNVANMEECLKPFEYPTHWTMVAIVLYDFIRRYKLKIPYRYLPLANSVVFYMRDRLHKLPVLKDVYGYGWIDMIEQESVK